MNRISSLLALALIASSAVTTSAQTKQPSTVLGQTDINALIEAAPAMPGSTTDALRRAEQLNAIYDPFFQQVAAAHNLLKQAIASRSKDMPDQATVMQQSKAQVNSNALIAGMGGVDNIQRMTPEQREAAARRSAQMFQQNLQNRQNRVPGSANMQATMQRLMADPNFMKLSGEEKEAAFRQAMGAAPESAQAQQPAGGQIGTANAIRDEITQMGQRLGEIDRDFVAKDQEITAAPGSHDQIARQIGAKIEQVPIVELGEYGRDRDPAQVTALLRQQAALDHARAEWELQKRTALHAERVARYKDVVNTYGVWLKNNVNRINTSVAHPLDNTNTEIAVAQYEDGLIGLAEELAKYTENVTRNAALYEKAYQDALSGSAVRTGRPAKKK